MKNVMKSMAFIMAAMLATSFTAFADDAAKSAMTTVNASVNGNYSITVPERVTLTGSGGTGVKTASLDVTLKGDIPEDKVVTVTTVPPVMIRSGAKDVTATVETPKTTWSRDDLLANSKDGTKSEYTVSATLTPSDWTGTATFSCSMS